MSIHCTANNASDKLIDCSKELDVNLAQTKNLPSTQVQNQVMF